MESTKSQLVLRSMDMDGRSLGTERSSTFLGGRSQAESASKVRGALGEGDRFARLLERRAVRDVAKVASDVVARVREGRTDAAERTYNAREAQAKTWKPREERTFAREDAGASTTEAQAHQADPASNRRVQRGASEGAAGSAPAARASSAGDAPGASEIADPSAIEPDPNDVQGQAAPHSILLAPNGPMGSSATLTVAAGASATAPGSGTASAGAPSPVVALGGGAKAATAQPVQAIQPNEAARAARRPEGVAAPRPGLPAEEARALLDQVRIQILDGKREARIQLRPVELGRLDLLIRVDGKTVTAKIAAESPETLAVLEAHAPELRAWLARDGMEAVDLELSLIDAGSLDFAHGDDPARSGSSDRLGDGSGAGRRGRARRSSDSASGIDSAASDRAALLSSFNRSVAEGRVDIQA
ncbi:Flagellar hook-length control protein FliK [Planctomycetes bacterium Poly30]|uniref:Flagellar hook-length control protein FliK n=1 Tax=Saltatorellus ferox TaxID=2528018 RepID=A0A518F0Y3_9BACT|nr:Flagellar hook-length control protein FliK [Planctomycetes bacterium Poly30]